MTSQEQELRKLRAQGAGCTFLCSPRTGSHNGNTQQEGQNEAIPGAPEPERAKSQEFSSAVKRLGGVCWCRDGYSKGRGVFLHHHRRSSLVVFQRVGRSPGALRMSRGQGRMVGAEKLED